MFHIISINLLTILEPRTGMADFQTYLGFVIAKKGADLKLVLDFSVS